MKNVIVTAILLFGLITFAQEGQINASNGRPARMGQKQNFTPEQRAELQVKRMTLHLDLNQKQQVEVKKLVLEQAKKRETIQTEMRAKRESGVKPTDEERFANQSQMLDEKIAMKTAFKKILTPEQMAKFEENLANRSEKMQARRMNKSKKFANKK
ncbi:Spy/CpxP family protein refolding chaperone [Flavobacterium sp.]|uniref:Spy/CpxP family protein refolding chaperone n=1 Tax=Flavobacterium sp. TaxID=239 RepID=UPI0025C6A086|nr:Spy/CpxP family protein refolding chaperone [Flavobacterium sp.]MBA4153752.1 hypothetical protein [Flavobacterium sp.]